MKWLKYSTLPIGIFMLVLSLIAPKVQASTTQYNYSFQDNTYYGTANQASSLTAINTTTPITIQYSSIILSSNDYNLIFFYDNNGNELTTLDYRNSSTPSTLIITVPQNSVTFTLVNDLRSQYSNRPLLADFKNIVISYNSPAPTTTDINNITWLENTKVDIANGTVTTNSAYRTTELIDVSTYINLKLSDNQASGTYTWTWLSVYDSNYNYVGVVHPSNASSQDLLWQSATFLQSSLRSNPNVVLDLTNYDYIRINQYVNNTDTDLWPNISPTFAVTYGNDISINTNIGLYTITFNDHLNQQVAQYTVVENANLSSLKSNTEANLPPREGYVFNGWDPDLNVATANATLTAQWQELIYYEVTFLDYDNSFIASVLVQQGQQATLPPTPLREHYVFSHWEPPVADVQGNITTVAQYNPATYQVTWRDQQGNTLKIETVQYSGVATAPNYTPSEGLVVNGWLDNDLPLPQVPLQSPIQIDSNKIFVVSLATAPESPIPSDYSPITDLLGGVMGASVGAIMTLGTINLFGIYLYQLIFLFIGTTLTLWILKAVRG